MHSRDTTNPSRNSLATGVVLGGHPPTGARDAERPRVYPIKYSKRENDGRKIRFF